MENIFKLLEDRFGFNLRLNTNHISGIVGTSWYLEVYDLILNTECQKKPKEYGLKILARNAVKHENLSQFLRLRSYRVVEEIEKYFNIADIPREYIDDYIRLKELT
mgnify:CR=1 FL=1